VEQVEVTVVDAQTAVMQRAQQHHARFGPHNLRTNFRHWRRSRPFWGGLWAILGGALMMYGPLTAIRFVLVAGQTIWLGVAVGLLVSVFGLFLWFAPALRQITAVLIVLLSVVSFITSDLGGFLAGMLLGCLGGSMGFAWMPMEPKVRRRMRRAVQVEHAAGVVAVTGVAVPTLRPDLTVPEVVVHAEVVEETPARRRFRRMWR
jgi:hypothetical protein